MKKNSKEKEMSSSDRRYWDKNNERAQAVQDKLNKSSLEIRTKKFADFADFPIAADGSETAPTFPDAADKEYTLEEKKMIFYRKVHWHKGYPEFQKRMNPVVLLKDILYLAAHAGTGDNGIGGMLVTLFGSRGCRVLQERLQEILNREEYVIGPIFPVVDSERLK